jgi:hypothetical protein
MNAIEKSVRLHCSCFESDGKKGNGGKKIREAVLKVGVCVHLKYISNFFDRALLLLVPS